MLRLLVLPHDWTQLSLGYEAQGAQAKLRSCDHSRPDFQISEADLEECDPSGRRFVLTPSASAHFLQSMDCDQPGRLEGRLNQRAFWVIQDPRESYGGIFLPRISAMAVDFPVARVAWEGDRLILSIEGGVGA